MLNLKEFEEIKSEMENFEEEREKTITISRNIIRLSKQLIYSAHRGDFKSAKEAVGEINKLVEEIKGKREDVGMTKVAFQEYAEAVGFYCFIKEGRLITRKELGISTEDYLIGVCDLTGEMVRKALNDIINGDYDSALKVKDAVNEIYGVFLKLDFRNGELRKRFDSIKWNLRKLEDLALNIKLIKK
ncbi:hypothetical protein HY643_04620 [Candidatus Woesearchaeota archaeon]|nr:hypothetical protein [Candidatus Woesearchaeota archaeon]